MRVSSVSWSFSSVSSIKTTPSAESQAYQSSLSLTRFGRGGAGTSTEMPLGNSLIVHPVPDKLESFRRLAIKSPSRRAKFHRGKWECGVCAWGCIPHVAFRRNRASKG